MSVIIVSLQSNVNFLDVFSNDTEIKFRENPSTGSRVVACGRADKTKPAATFKNVAKNTQNIFRVQFYFASFLFFYLTFVEKRSQWLRLYGVY